MEYLFVDLENIAPKSVSGLPPDLRVYLFVGEKQAKIGTDLVKSLLERGDRTRLIRVSGGGKNAADFHVAYYLGRFAEADKGGSFRILSKDKGFDALVRHLQALKVDCARIEELPVTLPKSLVQGRLQALVAHLRELPEKSRPKKVKKLKAYVKNWAKKDELLVEPLFNGLLAEKRIELEGETIRYSMADPR